MSWMFSSKMRYNLLVNTNYKILRATYDAKTQSNEEPLDSSGKKKIHSQNLQILKIDICKCLSNVIPPFA